MDISEPHLLAFILLYNSLPNQIGSTCVIEEGNGNPLQCSCLENPRDGGAWWAAVYVVAQSQTRLKRLSSSSSMNTCMKTNCNSERDGNTRTPDLPLEKSVCRSGSNS